MKTKSLGLGDDLEKVFKKTTTIFKLFLRVSDTFKL